MSERTKKIYHFSLLILSLLLVIAFAIYVHQNFASFEKIKTINFSLIILLLGVHAFHYFLLGITHSFPLRKHNIRLKLKEWYGLCTISELFNMLLPAKGGTVIRMMYMNDKNGLPLREFLSMGLAVVLAGSTLLGTLGFFYCHFFLQKQNVVFEALESLFTALLISSFLLMFFSEAFNFLTKSKRKYSPKKYLKDKNFMIVSLACYAGMFILYPLKIYLSFEAIGIHIQMKDLLEISLILLTSSFFQILPGNIGIKELATAYIAQQYGIQFEAALVASLLDRAILMLFLFPFGSYFYWKLLLGAKLPQKPNWFKQLKPSQEVQI